MPAGRTSPDSPASSTSFSPPADRASSAVLPTGPEWLPGRSSARRARDARALVRSMRVSASVIRTSRAHCGGDQAPSPAPPPSVAGPLPPAGLAPAPGASASSGQEGRSSVVPPLASRGPLSPLVPSPGRSSAVRSRSCAPSAAWLCSIARGVPFTSSSSGRLATAAASSSADVRFADPILRRLSCCPSQAERISHETGSGSTPAHPRRSTHRKVAQRRQRSPRLRRGHLAHWVVAEVEHCEWGEPLVGTDGGPRRQVLHPVEAETELPQPPRGAQPTDRRDAARRMRGVSACMPWRRSAGTNRLLVASKTSNAGIAENSSRLRLCGVGAALGECCARGCAARGATNAQEIA